MCALCLGSVLCRQELEERGLLKLYQNWDERLEEHLTLRQEEGEGRPARGSPTRGRSLSPQEQGGLGGEAHRGLQITPLT